MKHTIQSANQLMNEHIVGAVKKSFEIDKVFIEIEGELGQLSSTSELQKVTYKYHYGVKLSDGADQILLDIPRELIDAGNISPGEYVSVFGFIKTKLDNYTYNRLEFRLEVSKISSTDSPAAIEQFKKEQATIGKIKSLNLGKNIFPFKENLSVSLITGRNSEVEADFMHEITKSPIKIEVEKIAIDITSATEIVKAINGANGDIVTLIRGGGDNTQFAAFNNMLVIETLARKTRYRILGLGHSNNSTLLELSCDYSANTPTAAGTHIREMLKSYEDIQVSYDARRKKIVDKFVIVIALLCLGFWWYISVKLKGQ